MIPCESFQELKADSTEEVTDAVLTVLALSQKHCSRYSCYFFLTAAIRKCVRHQIKSSSVLTLRTGKHGSVTHYELSYVSDGNYSVKVFMLLSCKCFFFSKWLIEVVVFKKKDKWNWTSLFLFNYRLSFSAPFVKIITHTFNGCMSKHQTLAMPNPSGSRSRTDFNFHPFWVPVNLSSWPHTHTRTKMHLELQPTDDDHFKQLHMEHI